MARQRPYKLFDRWANRKNWDPYLLNNDTFLDYFYRLEEICINMFEWKNIPDTIDARFLELTLCEYGFAVYFNEEDIGNVALTCALGGPLNIYREPIYRRAYANNGFQRELNEDNSVLIFNNYLHHPSILTIMLFARRLAEIERTIDVNVKAQKTPVVITCDETQLLTVKNAYKDMSENVPVIVGSKNMDWKNISALQTGAPFVSLELNNLKRQIWQEAMTFFGVSNSNTEKKERQIGLEVSTNLGSVIAQRYVMLNARREAANKINKMFGTDIEVNFRQDFSTFNIDMPTTTDYNIEEETEMITGNEEGSDDNG